MHERIEVAPHVVAAEKQREKALDNGVEELKLDVTCHADEEKRSNNFVEALAVGYAATLAVPKACDDCNHRQNTKRFSVADELQMKR